MPRYFIALSFDDVPLFQRQTLRPKPYRSASRAGQFSSNAGTYELRVIEVATPIEWVARAKLENGDLQMSRSKSSAIGRNYIRYEYELISGGRTIGEQWTKLSAIDYAREHAEAFQRYTQKNTQPYFKLLAYAQGEVEIRHWHGTCAYFDCRRVLPGPYGTPGVSTSRIDSTTLICSSCGLREVDPAILNGGFQGGRA